MSSHFSYESNRASRDATDIPRQDELTRLAARLEKLSAESEQLTAELQRLQQQGDHAAREREQWSKKATQRLILPDLTPRVAS